MIKVQIPATSANIGSGFDSLGLAVTMYNTIEMEEADCLDIKRWTAYRFLWMKITWYTKV